MDWIRMNVSIHDIITNNIFNVKSFIKEEAKDMKSQWKRDYRLIIFSLLSVVYGL